MLELGLLKPSRKQGQMTDLLQQAIAELNKLPDEQQNSMAQWILAELKDDARWTAAFAKSLPLLEQMAQKARNDYEEGRTQPLDLA